MDQSIKRRKRWAKELKEKAKVMRINGRSFPEIVADLKIPKSTLHSWLRDLGRPEKYSGDARKLWFKEMQKIAVEANRKKYSRIYSNITHKAQSEANETVLDKNVYKPLLSMLYWAEGAKGRHDSLVFANTDPKLVFLYITLLRKCYQLDESKFRVRIHLHHYHNEEKVKKFWSDLLQIPLSKFGKTYRKERNNEKSFRQNFGGICFVVYNSVYLKEEVIQFGKALGEKIAGPINIPEVSANWA